MEYRICYQLCWKLDHPEELTRSEFHLSETRFSSWWNKWLWNRRGDLIWSDTEFTVAFESPEPVVTHQKANLTVEANTSCQGLKATFSIQFRKRGWFLCHWKYPWILFWSCHWESRKHLTLDWKDFPCQTKLFHQNWPQALFKAFFWATVFHPDDSRDKSTVIWVKKLVEIQSRSFVLFSSYFS